MRRLCSRGWSRGTAFRWSATSCSGTRCSRLPHTATITPETPSANSPTALFPRWVARIRSVADGVPPRTTWPNEVRRVSRPISFGSRLARQAVARSLPARARLSPPPSASPSFSPSTGGWNSATAQEPSSSPLFARPCIACPTCAPSCAPPTSVSSPSWRASTTPTPPSRPSTRWPNRYATRGTRQRPLLPRLQSVPRARLPALSHSRQRRMGDQRLSRRPPAYPSAHPLRQPLLVPAQAPAHPRPHQENRPSLQVLPDQARAAPRGNRPRHPRIHPDTAPGNRSCLKIS
jgi:hypothetical protein